MQITKQEKENNMAKGAMTKSPKTGGKVYAGGSPNFDESKGRYTSPPRGSERLSPGVYRTPSGGLMSGKGRPLPSTGQQGGQALAGNLPGAQNPVNLIGSMPPGTNINEIINRVTGLNNDSNNVFGPKGPAPVEQNPGMAVAAGQAAGQAAANYNPYQYAQPQNLGLSQLSNMSGDQIQQYLNQRGQTQQPQQMQPLQMQPQQMPQPSANMGGQYRLSPGVYGTREQAMRQYEQQMQPAGFNPSMYQRVK
jgi:hypothetical protein